MLFLLLATTTPAPLVAPIPARASVRILQPARASERVWRSMKQRNERPIVDEHGQKRQLRTINFE